MSVVNRMLQDIDRRMGEAGVQAHHPHPDIRTVPAAAAAAGSRQTMVAAIAVVLAAAAAAAYLTREPAAGPGAAPAPAPRPVPLAATLPAPAPTPVAPVPTPQPQAAAAAAHEEKVTPGRRAVEAFRLSLNLSADPPAAPARAMAAKIEAVPAKLEPAAAAAAAVPAPKVEAAPPRPAEVRRTEVPVRRVAADETVAVAASLWNDGARGEALATLRDALALAEPRNPAAVPRLARELARLELAGDRPQDALEVLRRLEGLLAQDADAWALRGNAAQRLSLHAEAASAYLAATRLRPEEGKWMLGAAISLAAEGRHEEARPLVQRARERGAITPAIATYLQQLGLGAGR